MSPARLTPLLAFYRAAARLAAPLVAWRMGRRDAAGGYAHGRWRERLGHAALPRPEGRLVWLHGASVGESLSLLPLISRLAAADPALRFLVTSGTATSAEVMAARLPPAALHQFAPLDSGPVLRRFLRHWRPSALILAESEIWPGWIIALHDAGVPVVLAGGRLSARAAEGWARRPRTALALFSRLSLVLARDEAARGLFARLGTPPEALATGGDIKAAAPPPPGDPAMLAALQEAFGARPVWAAVSTHPGEEEMVLGAHAALLKASPDALLILAPRHPERGGDVAALATARGLTLARRSAGETAAPGMQVLLADTLGETGLWFRLAPAVFLGGSLVPVGGHNPWEIAALGRPVLHGPHVGNAPAAWRALAAAGAAVVVTQDNLAGAVTTIWEDPEDAARRGAAGLAALKAEAARAEAGLDRLVALVSAAG